MSDTPKNMSFPEKTKRVGVGLMAIPASAALPVASAAQVQNVNSIPAIYTNAPENMRLPPKTDTQMVNQLNKQHSNYRFSFPAQKSPPSPLQVGGKLGEQLHDGGSEWADKKEKATTQKENLSFPNKVHGQTTSTSKGVSDGVTKGVSSSNGQSHGRPSNGQSSGVQRR